MLDLRKLSPNIKNRIRAILYPSIQKSTRQKFSQLSISSQSILEKKLVSSYFSKSRLFSNTHISEYLNSPAGQKDLSDHIEGRLHRFRRTMIPWISQHIPLSGLNILEIGCGTGSSAIAFSEQGANVTGIDLDPDSLEVARLRRDLYGLDIKFLELNAIDVRKKLHDLNIELIIFTACLEHMTYLERIRTIKETWAMLPEGGHLVIVETPNRLWFFDGHTSYLPFFSWLPDQLALDYSIYSPRSLLKISDRQNIDQAIEMIYRHGRGVSYHEFEVALNQPGYLLNVVSCLAIFLRRSSPLAIWELLHRFTLDAQYSRLIRKVGQDVHPGFYEPSLDLIIKK